LAEQLDDEALREKVEALKAQVELASEAVITAADEMAVAAEDSDTRIDTALTGNTVTAAFEAVAASAETNFPIAIDWIDNTTLAVANFDSQITTTAAKWAAFITGVQADQATLGQAQAAAPVDGTRAAGGDILANRDYLVGEQGPEIVSTRASGMVFDAPTTRAMMNGGAVGGVTNNYVYNINTTQHIQSQAQAEASGYALARSLRGQ